MTPPILAVISMCPVHDRRLSGIPLTSAAWTDRLAVKCGLAERRPSRHATCVIRCLAAWITKYRCRVLREEMAERARELIRQTCEIREMRIARGGVAVYAA